MDRLKDKVCIITGTNSGIGRAAAYLFCAEGAKVVMAGRREERGREIEADLRSKGYEADFVRTDISKEEDINALVDFTVQKYGRIDVLVNNAAKGGHLHYMAHELTDETMYAFIETNLLGAVRLVRRVAPYMLERKKGSIVNVASVAAELGVHEDCMYGATKGAIRQYTKAVAVDYAKLGVRVNCVLPGLTKTEMSGEVSDDIMPNVPIGRMAQPEEIANGILFLASDEASFCVGMSMIIDGGETIN